MVQARRSMAAEGRQLTAKEVVQPRHLAERPQHSAAESPRHVLRQPDRGARGLPILGLARDQHAFLVQDERQRHEVSYCRYTRLLLQRSGMKHRAKRWTTTLSTRR